MNLQVCQLLCVFRTQSYKIFYNHHLKVKVFVPGQPFQTHLMSASKAVAYLSEPLFRCSTLGQASGLTNIRQGWKCQPWTKLISLLQTLINYGRKKFYNIGPSLNFENFSDVCLQDVFQLSNLFMQQLIFFKDILANCYVTFYIIHLQISEKSLVTA